jgi:hypothetical protein
VTAELVMGQSHNTRIVNKDSRLNDFFGAGGPSVQTIRGVPASKGYDKGRKITWQRF